MCNLSVYVQTSVKLLWRPWWSCPNFLNRMKINTPLITALITELALSITPIQNYCNLRYPIIYLIIFYQSEQYCSIITTFTRKSNNSWKYWIYLVFCKGSNASSNLWSQMSENSCSWFRFFFLNWAKSNFFCSIKFGSVSKTFFSAKCESWKTLSDNFPIPLSHLAWKIMHLVIIQLSIPNPHTFRQRNGPWFKRIKRHSDFNGSVNNSLASKQKNDPFELFYVPI